MADSSTTSTMLSVPSVADIENLIDPVLSRQRRLSEYADIVIGPTVNGITTITEEEGPLNQFEEKVQLEISRSGNGLVISPSTAAMMQLTGHEFGKRTKNKKWRRSSSKKRQSNILEEHLHMINLPKHNSQKKKTGWRKYGGLIFAFSSSFFFSLTVVMVKILNAYHPFSTAVWRYSGIFLPSIPIILYYWNEDRKNSASASASGDKDFDAGIEMGLRRKTKENPGIFHTISPLSKKENLVNFFGLLMRGLLGCTSVLFRFYSLKFLDVADSSVISYSGPIFVVIVAHFVLGEKCGFVSVFVALITAFGVFVICRPPIFTQKEFNSEILMGALLATLSMICNSTVSILMRKIRQVHFSLMLFTFGLWGTVESFIVAVSFEVMEFPQGYIDIILSLLVLPVLTFLGQMSIILALKFENAGPVSLIRSCDVIFSFVWQFIFLGVQPNSFSVIGASIVVFGVSITAVQKWVSTLPEDDNRRKKLRFILK